jgi:hypothetical protein
MLSLSACSTLVAVPLKIELPANLREPCADLRAVDIADDEDIRIAWLTSRANDRQVHEDCKAKAAALVRVIDGK